jgi:hypothetical protein
MGAPAVLRLAVTLLVPGSVAQATAITSGS